MNPAKPASLRKQQADFTRKRLIEAARDLFSQHGTKAVTIDDIARAAGASRATFYAHFNGKDGVLHELLDENWRRSRELYLALGELPDWSLPSITRWIETMFQAWEQHGTATTYIIEAMASEVAAEYHKRYHTEFVSAVLHQPENWAHLRREEAERRASMLIFQCERTMQEWVARGWQQERGALKRSFATLWHAALNAPDTTG